MRGSAIGRLLLLAAATMGTAWAANITSLNSSFPPPEMQTITALTSLVPSSAAAGNPGTSLIVNGIGFEPPDPGGESPGSVVTWKNGPILVTLPTTFVNGNQLQAVVDGSLLVAPGTASVSVLQPSDISLNSLPFVILPPTIISLSPGSIGANANTFTLSINGSAFLPTSTVTFGGTPLTATFVNAGLITAQVPAGLLKVGGAVPVVVTNPGPNASAPANFIVNPSISGLSPSNIPAGSAAFPMSITGAGFVASLASSSLQSVVSFNGVNLPTTVVNSGLLTVTVPANLVTTEGNYPVVVTNPGGSASLPATFTVTPRLSIVTTSLNPGTAGTLYNATLVGRGGTPPYTWTATALPAALGLNPVTGVLSGIPLAGGTFVVAVTLKDAVGTTASAQFPLTISTPAVTISPGNLPNGTVGVPYAGTVGATGGTGPYTFSLSGGKLPDGLSLSSGGTVSGTPKTPGTFSFSVNVSDSAGGSTGRDFTITIVPAPLVITPGTGGPGGTSGTVGTPINIPITVTGGVGPYRCSEVGALPPGTKFGDCAITGTPTTPGTYGLVVTVTDSVGASAVKEVSVVIAPPGLTLTGAVGNGQVGVAYSGKVTAAGGTPPYTYTISGLPDGLSASATGAITGTPTTAGQSTVTGSVVDAAGAKASATFGVTIIPADLMVTTASLPDGVVNSPYTFTLGATGGVKPYTWTVSGLPGGLSATAAGVISGTPSTAGTLIVSVSVKDAVGASAAQRLSITIAPPALTITTATLPNGTVTAAYSATLNAGGGVPPYTWSATGLPPGLTISTTGTISGTPTTAGNYTITATVQDSSTIRVSAGLTASRAFPITIGLPPVPPLSYGGVTSSAPPFQQPQVTVSLGTIYPVDVVATLTLSFKQDSGIGDPAIAFSNGFTYSPDGRTTKITIPAGATAGATSVGLQTGTVAGLITITSQLQAAGQDMTPNPPPTTTIRIAALAPVPLTITAVRNTTGFTVAISGYVTDREVTQVIYTFNGAPGGNLQTPGLTIPVDTLFSGYFGSDRAIPFGGQFLYTQPFTINGNQQAIVSVTVTMVNKIGQSTAATVNLN